MVLHPPVEPPFAAHPQVRDQIYKDIKTLMIAPFSGATNENATRWLETLLHKLHSLQIPQDRAALLMPLLLTGETIAWFHALPLYVQGSFHRLMEAFKTRFISGGRYQEQTNRTMFYHASQFPGEGVRPYAQRIRETASRVGINDDNTLKSKFLAGLTDEVRLKISLFPTDSFYEAIELAEAAESQLPLASSQLQVMQPTEKFNLSCFQTLLDKIDKLAENTQPPAPKRVSLSDSATNNQLPRQRSNSSPRVSQERRNTDSYRGSRPRRSDYRDDRSQRDRYQERDSRDWSHDDNDFHRRDYPQNHRRNQARSQNRRRESNTWSNSRGPNHNDDRYNTRPSRPNQRFLNGGRPAL